MQTVSTARPSRERPLLFLLFFVFYMTDAAFGYFSIYLKSIGFSTLQMGVLTSGASLAAMLFLPWLGALSDRSANRNRDFVLLLLAAAVLAPIMSLNKGFLYLLALYVLFTVFRTLQRPICDSMALEHTKATGTAFGPIRVMGCLGYAVMALVAGRIANDNLPANFLLFAGASVATAIVVAVLPRFRGSGDAAKRGRGSLGVLLQYKSLVALVIFAVFFVSTKSFYQHYFSVYFTESLGGTPSMYGWLISMGALLEIPFTFFLDRLIRKLGVGRIIAICGLSEGLRWLLAFLVADPLVQIVTQMVLASTNMIFTLAMTVHINDTVAPEHRVTGLATYSSITSLASILIGNFGGGALGNLFGIRPIFLICSIVNLLTVLAFCLYMAKARRETGSFA